MPSVSVIVPNYNHARFLPKRVESILRQTYQDFELILLDDRSTDDSRSILREYASDSRVRLEFNEVNSGSTFKQWNKGVRLAQGEYVWIAESDDYADEHFLERLVPVLRDNPRVHFAYCRSWCVNDDDRRDGFAERRFAGWEQFSWDRDYCGDGRETCGMHMIRSNMVQNASAVLLRRSAYNYVGGADESMRLCGDWRLWVSLMLLGQMAYVAEPLNYFRFHGDTVRTKLEVSRSLIEWFSTVRWIMDRVDVSKAALEKARAEQAQHWVPAVLSFHVPWTVKREILTSVRAVDPRPFQIALRPAIGTFERKIKRHWRKLRGMFQAERAPRLTKP